MTNWVKSYVDEHGIAALLVNAMKNARTLIFHVKRLLFSKMDVIVLQIDLRKIASTSEAAIPLRFEEVTERNVTDILQVEPSYKVAQYRNLMNREEVGYYVYSNTDIAHRCWVVDKPGPAPTCGGNHSFPLSQGDMFVHLSRTYPAFQRKRVYPATLSFLCKKYLEGGYRRGLIAVESENQPSMEVVRRMGYQPLARQRVVIVMGLVYRSQDLMRPPD